jgi:excisionase family DNA binding protein
MKSLVCPHCQTPVSDRARVCSGCGAEVVRGATRRERFLVGVVFAVAAFLILTVVLRMFQIERGSLLLPSPKAERSALHFSWFNWTAGFLLRDRKARCSLSSPISGSLLPRLSTSVADHRRIRSTARAKNRSPLRMFGISMPTETLDPSPPSQAPVAEPERLAYSIHEAADLLGVDYFSVYRLIQRGKLRACRALRGKLLVPRSELLRLLKG